MPGLADRQKGGDKTYVTARRSCEDLTQLGEGVNGTYSVEQGFPYPLVSPTELAVGKLKARAAKRVPHTRSIHRIIESSNHRQKLPRTAKQRSTRRPAGAYSPCPRDQQRVPGSAKGGTGHRDERRGSGRSKGAQRPKNGTVVGCLTAFPMIAVDAFSPLLYRRMRSTRVFLRWFVPCKLEAAATDGCPWFPSRTQLNRPCNLSVQSYADQTGGRDTPFPPIMVTVTVGELADY